MTLIAAPRRWAMALLIAALALTGLGLAAKPAHALGKGRVCMINAPTGAPLGPWNLGHVGWAFRVGPADDWIYGATESPSYNWQSEANYATMVSRFKSPRSSSGGQYYESMRCRDTNTSSVGSAKNMVNTLYGQPYDLAGNNCLTRSVKIFMAYDSSLGLTSGAGAGPNAYYDYTLPQAGFSNRIYI